jgi:hypothetical protein
MKRSNILFTLLFVWIFAIFAPSVITLYNNDGNTILTSNLNEEEQQEQGEKNQGEKKIVKENSSDFSLLAAIKKSELGNFYFMAHTDHTVEILLPPPERT